ncbi:pentapeptide repeat-containing protein [Candidatus Uhrbacteria bacterium]|nr:pentapeptide repeat-containing protein [Candidatus Uhrbacteria bacterium]
MDRADLTSARLRGTFQHLTSMQGTILRHTKLAEVNLCEAICQADLTEADLRGAGRLYEILKPGAQLQGVDLSGETIEADLTGANLSKARLIETDLRGATLVRVNLDNANIAGAQFTPRGLRQFDISRSLVTTKREDGTYIEGVVTDYLYR